MHSAPQSPSATTSSSGTPGDPRAGRPAPDGRRTSGSVPAPEPAPTAPGGPSRAVAAPVLRHRRDGILPAVGAALSVRGETLTCTGSKSDEPPELHPLVRDFLASLDAGRRERHTGRCAETVLVSRFLTSAEAARAGKRAGKRAGRKPYTEGDARKALKHAKLTARHIREDGDPRHGSYAPPCRSCTALLGHFGVRAVDPGPREAR